MIDGSRCVIRIGKPGCGKTLDQTEQDVLPALLDGEEVYCSYWLNWALPNYHYFPPSFEGWESVSKVRNALFVFDEIAQIADPRDFQQETKAFRAWVQLHRHMHNGIVGNTQDVSLVAKTFGIVADEWQYLEKPNLTWFHLFFYDLFGLHRIRFHKYAMTWQRLKKLANTAELDEDIDMTDDKFSNVTYDPKTILHEELDDYKVELVHSYCPKCAYRQGPQILKEDTEKYAEYDEKYKEWYWKDGILAYCDKHTDVPLILKKTGIYDTDYMPDLSRSDIVEKSFRRTLVEKLVPC